MTHSSSQSGFTLVELSIVLVIIGLIVSGVLVGQDMIRAAEVRSTIGQIESYNTAVNTFRDKYRGLPGDILSADAARFGFTVRSGAPGQGDGDRLVEFADAGTGTTLNALGHETALFWSDLSQVGLISGDFTTATDAEVASATASDIAGILPEADIGQGHFITVFSNNGRNFYEITRVISTDADGVYTLEAAMTPQTAFNIDDKMDNGNPLTGTVTGLDDATALGTVAAAAVAAAGVCVEDANNDYNTAGDAFANAPACQLGIRAAF